MKTLMFQRCFIGILINSYLQYTSNGRKITEPKEIIDARDDWFGKKEDTDYISRFLDTYEITDKETDYVESSDITMKAVITQKWKV